MAVVTAQVSVLTALLFLQVLLAKRIGRVLRLLATVQAVFWFFGFVARPLYLVLVQPPSSAALGDPRMVLTGYVATVQQLLLTVMCAQIGFVAGLWLWLLLRRKGSRSASDDALAGNFVAGYEVALLGWMFLAIGWLGRLLALQADASVSTALTPFGVAGMGLLIVSFVSRSGKAWNRGVICVLFSELSWGLLNASKTSFVMPLVAVAVGMALDGREGARGKRVLVATGVMVLVGFAVIQPLKGVNTASELTVSYGRLGGLSVAVLERFDGISGVADAHYLGAGSWMSSERLVATGVALAVPGGRTTASGDETLGQMWTREVRSQSFHNQYQDVSLAAGPAAEGYAIAGRVGSIIEGLLMAIVSAFVSTLVGCRRSTALVVGLYFILSTGLLERGILGVLETANKAAQIGFACAVVVAFLRLVQKGSTTIPQRRGARSEPDAKAVARPRVNFNSRARESLGGSSQKKV